GEPDAALALAVHAHRLRGGIAAMAAALDGLDALVFTGGVGEHDAATRAEACAGLGFLGVRLGPDDPAARGDRDVAAQSSAVRVLVVESREDVEIARRTRRALGHSG
ncbi:MAG TPA: acetate/propionate family kinase, partial [Pseudonocardiaceae bacterium]